MELARCVVEQSEGIEIRIYVSHERQKQKLLGSMGKP